MYIGTSPTSESKGTCATKSEVVPAVITGIVVLLTCVAVSIALHFCYRMIHSQLDPNTNYMCVLTLKLINSELNTAPEFYMQ